MGLIVRPIYTYLHIEHIHTDFYMYNHVELSNNQSARGASIVDVRSMSKEICLGLAQMLEQGDPRSCGFSFGFPLYINLPEKGTFKKTETQAEQM